MMSTATIQSDSVFDVARVRKDFPAVNKTVRGRAFAYLDSAASAQKPIDVVTAMDAVVFEHYANVHRGIYAYAQQTTEAFESARTAIAAFIGAPHRDGVIFTRNATEAINLVAASWGVANLKEGDEIILSTLEHHANIVPWHMIAQKTGARIKVVPLTHDLAFDMEAYRSLLNEKTRMVAVTQLSNALGVPVDVALVTRMAHEAGAKVLIDGSQGVVHGHVDVSAIGCDFYAFTGHKLYGPTGIGVLCASPDMLNAMPPYQGGGEMIEQVSFDAITYKKAPNRFEAGTPPIVEAIGLGAAVEYMNALDRDAAMAHEAVLAKRIVDGLRNMGGVTVYAPDAGCKGIVSFNIDGVHPHDAATIFDQMAVAMRAGHHCCQPLMKHLGVAATLRASVGIYNTEADVDNALEAVAKAKKMFKG